MVLESLSHAFFLVAFGATTTEPSMEATAPPSNRRALRAPGERKYKWRKGKGRERYRKWMAQLKTHPMAKGDWIPAKECFQKAAAASWWNWELGSRLFFWNWPGVTHRLWARDGQPHYQIADLPSFKKPQQSPRTAEDRVMVWKKLYSVRERLYIEPGEVISLMHFFYVPKGLKLKDIRMVYNGTASGVNDCLFAPHFSLPTITPAMRALAEGYYQADMDIGEMFLNFMLGKELRPYSGVDVTHIRTQRSDLQHYHPEPLPDIPDWEKERIRAWERWGQNWKLDGHD
jgi:hypothetical protein